MTSLPAFYGQKIAVRQVENAIRSNAIEQPWLFVGPRGTGKTTLARALAYSLLKGDAHGFPALGGSPPPADILASSSYNELSSREGGEGITSVKDIRKITKKLATMHGATRWRAMLITGIDQITADSCNALLKAIEEPPTRTVFLLTSNCDNVLPTIESRCRRIRMRAISDDLMDTFLTDRELDTHPRRRLALELGAGSPGATLTMLESDEPSDDVARFFGSLEPRVNSQTVAFAASKLARKISAIRDRQSYELWVNMLLNRLRTLAINYSTQGNATLAASCAADFEAGEQAIYRTLLLNLCKYQLPLDILIAAAKKTMAGQLTMASDVSN